MVFLHGSGSAYGRNLCAVVTGPASAAGQTVNFKGQSITLVSGKCNPLMMGGNPLTKMSPQDFSTSGGNKVHWDGNVWSI